MKLSLSWLFDHIDADWRTIDVAALVSLFNKTTAEIEGFDKISIDLKKLGAAQRKYYCRQKWWLKFRNGNIPLICHCVMKHKVGAIYLIAKESDAYCWATRNIGYPKKIRYCLLSK